MNKLIVSLILIFVVAGSLCAQKMHEDENPFMTYYQDQTSENLIKAIEYFSSYEEHDMGLDNKIMLANLYLVALEKEIDYFKANIDSLDMRDKFRYANLLLALNRFDEAVVIYEDLNTSAPNWSCPWRHKGEAFFKSEKLEEAENALKQAIVTRVEHFDAYVMLADVQNDMGKSAEALETLETGFSYLGEDIEDPEEEVDDLDVKFLYLELLKKNNRQDDYDKLKSVLIEITPDDERLKDKM